MILRYYKNGLKGNTSSAEVHHMKSFAAIMHPTFLPYYELCVRYIVTNCTEIRWSQWSKVNSSHRIFLRSLHAVCARSCQPFCPPGTGTGTGLLPLTKCEVQHGKKIHITRKRRTADSDILTRLSFVQSCPAACKTHEISPSVIWETGCYVQTKKNGTLVNESHTGSSTVAPHGIAFKLWKTKRNLLYIRNQSVPRCKYSPPRL